MKQRFTLIATLALLLGMILPEETKAQCGAQALPMVEHFESCGQGSASALPGCWVRLKNYDNSSYPYVMNYGGNRVMRMYCGNLSYHFSMLTMPAADVSSLSQCYLLFKAWPESAGAKLVVGVSSDTTLMGHGFVAVDTIELGTVGEWEDYLVPLASYTGTGKYVTFRFAEEMQESTSSYVRLDDVMLTTCGVDSLMASYLTHSSVRLNFTTYGNPTVNLEYGPYGFAAGTGTTVAGVTSPHTVDGLNTNTNYTFRLSPVCGATPFGDGTKRIDAQTLSGGSESAPLCEGPEGYHNGDTWASPYVTNSLSGLTVAFRAQSSYYYGRTIEVATTAYPEEEQEWTRLDTIELTPSWEYYAVPLTGAPSGDHHVVLRMTGGGLYIEDFSIAATYQHDAQAEALGETSIEVSWQGGSGATLEYGPQGFAAGSGTTVSGSSPQTLTGLTAGTDYDIIVTPTSGGGQGCATRISATTWAAPVAAPYCEDFEAASVNGMPAGWIVPEGSPAEPYVSSSGYEGSRSLYMYANTNSYNQHSCYAVLPAIGGDLSQLYVSFQGNVSSFVGTRVIDVGVMTNPHDTSTFQLVETLQFPQANVYRHMQASLAGYQGSGQYIALRYRMTGSGNSGGCYVDNVRVTRNTVSACYDNTNPTANSITLNWTTTPAGLPVHIEWSTASNNFGSGTRAVVTTDSMYTITGLTANRNYYVYVWTGADSTCGYDFKFTHYTGAPTALPYCNDFSSQGNYTRPSDWQYTLMNGNDPHVDNNYVLVMTASATRQNLIALPPVAGDISNAVVAIEGYWYGTPRLVVGVMDVPSRVSSFTPVDTLDVAGLSSGSTNLQNFVVPLASYTGSGRHLALWLQEGSFYMNRLSIAQQQLENVRTTEVSDTSVTIAWDVVPAGATGNLYVAYGAVGFTVGGSGQIGCVQATGNPFTLTGLDETTEYDIVLLPQCGAGCPYARLSATTRGATLQPTVCYDFESWGQNYIPDGWVRSRAYGNYPRVYTNSSNAYNSSGYMEFYSYYESFNVIATSPIGVDDMSDLIVSFKYKYSSQYSSMLFVVGVMTDPEDPSTFVPVDTIRQDEASYTWRSYTRRLTGYTGTGRSVAFKYYDENNNGGSSFYMDNLTLSLCAIENERVTALGDESITVEWDEVEPYAGNGVIIEYATQPFLFGAGTRIYATTSPATIENLMPGQQYYIYVVPQCTEGNACGVNRLMASTTNGMLQPPYCENFEGDFPEDWYRPAMYDNAPYTTSVAYRCLAFETSGNSVSMMALPVMDNSVLRQSYLSCNIYFEYSNGCIDVGVMTNPYDTSTFSTITTLTPSNSTGAWHQHVVPLSSYQGTGGYVALRYRSMNGSYCHAYLEHLTLRTCNLSSVSVNHVTQTSAQVSWDTEGTNTGVWVEYALVGGADGDFMPGYGTRCMLTQSGTTIGGLMPGSYYAFHVWPQCDTVDDGCSYYLTNVQTVHPEVAFPHCEDFEEIDSYSFPNNWRRFTNNSTAPRVTNYDTEHGKVLRHESSGEGYYAITAMPPMGRGDTCTSLRGSTIRFSSYLAFPSYAPGLFEVGVMDDVSDSTTFTPVDTVVQASYTWCQHETSLANYTGMGRYVAFRLRATGSYSVYAYLDNVCVEACEVTNLHVSGIDQNSVSFSWRSSGDANLVCEYGPMGFTPGTGDTVHLLQSPTSITGLETGTTYQFRFLSSCDCDAYGSIRLGQGEGTWVGTGGGSNGGGNGLVIGTVTTEAHDLPLSYCTGFEGCDSVGFLSGWRRVRGSSTEYPRISPSRYHGGHRALEFYTTTQADNRYQSFVIMPLLPENTVSQLVMTFQALVANTYGTQEDAGFFVGVMTNPLDTTTFVPVSRIRPTASNSWQEQVVSFASYTGSGRYIAFKFAPRHATYSSFVDDIYLGYCAVSNVQYGNATSNTLQVSWTAHNNPTSVRVEYGAQGFRERGQAATTVNCTTNPFTITGLDCGESYDFYLIPSCNGVDGLCEQLPYTLNPSVSAPYCENFDGAQNDLPAHWTGHSTHAAGIDGPEVSDDGYLRMYPNTGVTGRRYAIMPPIHNTALANLTVSFNAWTDAGSYTRLVVGVMSDPTDMTSFVGVDTIQMTENYEWRHFVVPLASYQGTGDRITFLAFTNNGRHECFIDDLVVGYFVAPTDVEVHPMSADAVRITWAHDDSRTQPLSVEYGRLGFANGTEVQATGDEVVLAGLTPGTEYEFFFRLGDLAGGCERFGFTTIDRYALPFCEQFDASGELPEGWEMLSNGSYPYITSAQHYSGSNSLCMDANYTGQYVYVLLPEMEVDSVKDLSFEMMLYCYTGYNSRWLVLGVMEQRDDPTTFVPCDTISFTSSDNYTWRLRTASLRNYHGTGRTPAIRHMATTTYGGVYIDNITVVSHPNPTITAGPDNDVFCQVPDVSEVDYYLEYGRHGFLQGTGTVLHVTENPYHIENLPNGASFDFYSLSAPGEATCTSPTTLTIYQMPRQPLPLCEDFDSYGQTGVMPPHWSRIPGNDSYVGTETSGYVGSPYCLRIRMYSGDAARYAVLPLLDVDSAQKLAVSFNYKISYYNTGEKLLVGVLVDPADASTFQAVDTIVCPQGYNQSWLSHTTSLDGYPGVGRYLAFRFQSSSSNYLYLDNISVDKVAGVEVLQQDNSTARIVSSQYQPDFYAYYGLNDDPVSTYQRVHVTTNDHELTGLTPGSNYRFIFTSDSSSNGSCGLSVRLFMAYCVDLSYCESFDSYAMNSSPTGWVMLPSEYYAGYIQVATGGQSGKGLNFYSSYRTTSNMGVAVLPRFPGHRVNELAISLDYNIGRSFFEIGVIADPTDKESFIPLDTLGSTTSDNGGQWQHARCSFASYSGPEYHLAIRHSGTYTSSWNGYASGAIIDNIKVETNNIPVAITAYPSGVRQLTVDWDDTTLTDFWIDYGLQGVALGEGTLVHVDHKPMMFDSMATDSTYRFYALGDSIAGTCRQPAVARVLAAATVPYCEDFESYSTGSSSYPIHWQRLPRNNSNSSLYINATAQSGTRGLYFSSAYDTYATNSFALLPLFAVDDISQLNVAFDMKCAVGGYFQIGVMSSPVDRDSFVPVDSVFSSDPNVWQHVRFSLASYTGTGQFLAIRLAATTSSVTGNIDNISVIDCDIPSTFAVNTIAHNRIELSWEGDSSAFSVEYGPEGFTPGTGTLLVHPANPTVLTLANSTDFDFYTLCDGATSTCETPYQASTLAAPLEVPACIGFEECANSQVPEGWSVIRPVASYNFAHSSNPHSGSRCFYAYASSGTSAYTILPDLDLDSVQQLHLALWARINSAANGYLEIGVMSSVDDAASFIPVKRHTFSANNSYEHISASFAAYTGTGRFVALRTVSNTGSIQIRLDDLYLSTCGATDFAVRDLTNQSVTFTWNQTGTPAISLEYGPEGFTPGTGTLLHPQQSPYTLATLSPLTHYTFRLSADCADMGTYCSSDESATFNLFTPMGGTGCVDYTDLEGNDVTCTYGSYANPYANMGIVDYGYESVNSRHTVHYDTTATDPRTGGLLRVVPVGSDASVRLGNWGAGAEAESITYGLMVDSNDFDLLILKYAAVLQDPAHGASHQPRFRIQILDEEMNLVDADCGAADFIANQNLGWNVAANYVLWKDWTTVGLDLSPYAGQRIYVRLTTFDCGESTHYGYAYFTLNCMRKSMLASGCGYVAENTFTAPSGFAYRWYSSEDPATTISTEQSITVASNNDVTYYCDASFVDNANCYFTLSAFAGTRFPLADFTYSYTVEDCQFQVQFQNTSTISMDGETPLGTGEACESARWLFGNGLTSTSYHGSTTYAEAGSYDVTLYSGLAGDACVDSVTITIELVDQIVHPLLSGPAEACEGDTVTFTVDHARTFHRWSTGATTPTITFVADSSLLLRAMVTDSNGCGDTLSRTLHVHRLSHVPDYQSVCEEALPYLWQDSLSYSTEQNGTATVTLTDGLGCDSIVALHLTIHPSTDEHFYDTICDNQSYTFADSALAATGTYAFGLTNRYGCDSTVTMHLTVHATSASEEERSVCDSSEWNGAVYDTSGVFTFTTANALGCDSTATLTLTVRHSSALDYRDTIVENDLPRAFAGQSFTQGGDYTVTLENAAQCDSVISYSLHVWPNGVYQYDSTVCDDMLPLAWDDSLFTAAGEKSTLFLDQHGADSLVTLTLTVHSTYDHSTYDTICEGLQRPFGGNQYGSTGVYEHSYQSIHGCDSLSTLHLVVHPVTYDTVHDTILENQLPYTFNGHLCLDSGSFTITIANAMGCDSVITYHLYVHRNTVTMLDSAVCDSELPFLWDDTLFAAGSLIHTKHLHTAHGADSTVVMTLTVHPTYDLAFARSVCTDALPYSWQGFSYEADPDTLPYTHTDTLRLSLQSLHGCDSLATLALTVNRTSTSAGSHTACDSYEWNGTRYTLPGLCEHHLENALGCDSLATLELTLYYSDTTEESAVSCGEYQWNGQTYSETGDYEHLEQTAHGCDSVCVLHLRVPVIESERSEEACDSLRWNEELYTQGGTYAQQFRSVDGCDSIATLHLTVHRSSEERQQVTLCEGDLPYRYNDITYPYGTERGEQRIEYRDLHGCDSVIRLQLDIYYNPVLSVDMVRYRCYEGEFELTARHSADVDHVTWSSSPYDPTTLGQETANPILVSPHQATLYTATAQVPGTECQNSLTITVGPIVDLEAALSVTPGFATPSQSEITLRDESRGNVRTWQWLADGDEVGDRPSCTYRYPLERDSVEIQLIVTEPRYGCRDTARAVVPLLGGDLFAPNAFTPDESTNQRFQVQGKNIIDFEISIYARNGQRVYYSVDMAEGWDGRNVAGKPCPEGAYVYLVRYTTTEAPHNPVTQRGSVLLLR